MIKQIAVAGPMLQLPTERSIPAEALQDYSLLLFGEPKTGKTSLAAQFPDNLLLMFEPGAKALSTFQVTIHKWEDLKQYMALLQKDKKFRTITWDTIDVAYDMCLKYVCTKEGMDHPSDEAYGKGWNKVNSEFVGAVNQSLKMGKGVVFTSHAAERDIKTRTGEEYTKIVPTMSGAARKIIEALVDIWGYMYLDKDEQRHLRIRGNDHIAAGHRLQEHFVGISTIPMGKTAQEAHNNLIAAFNNQLKVATAVPQSKPKLVIGRKA